MAPEQLLALRTLRDLIRLAVGRFERAGLSYGHGTDNAYDEAAWMLSWALHLPVDHLEPHLDARLCDAERDSLLALIERRCRERVPAAYLLGEAWLRGRRFVSDARALVPRSLIGEALDGALDDWLEQPPDSVLDLCTGGGSLAILAAHRWPEADVVGADLSADALALAAENVALHGVGARVELLRGDLFDPVGERRFDLILCNPPYVNQASIDALPPEFRAEPPDALAGGADGMDLIRRLLDAAPAHLTPDGGLLLEIGHEAAFFEQAFDDLEFAYVPVAAGDDQLVWITRAALADRRRRHAGRAR
ncbi:MAG: 50S ribosomal protein L3 N(5)-glutamine methyltransferase [Burkholderiaceae bacterium]